MPLTAGQRLGPYEIESAIGAGGMGEVYRARDTRLDRTVAIKVLSLALADDPSFRERFDREARAISALTHPHICALFDVGTHEGMSFLVMEHLDGESLEARLAAKGGTGLPLREALTIAIDVASALDAAHRAGIVHRDLKPGNVMLTKSGAKLLDFGLAKTGPVIGPAKAGHYRSDGSVHLQADPTGALTLPRAITEQGTILGTFQYMAPEQIEGLEADARTDIFAFGALLFEMITGRKAFEGQTRPSLIGAILKDDPLPLSGKPVTVPALDHIVRRCLEKNPDTRWQTATDLVLELKWFQQGGGAAGSALPTTPAAGDRSRWPVALAGLLAGVLIGAAIAGSVLWRRGQASILGSATVIRSVVGVSPASQIQDRAGVEGRLNRTSIALSRDGRSIVFVALRDGQPQLYLRSLDQFEAVPIAGTERGVSPFLSPDGKWLGFWAGGELRKVPVGGGPPVTICKAASPFGASWGSDDQIVFSRVNGGLLQVAASGGSPQPLTTVDADKGEVSHRLPHVLPGGNGVLYTITRNRFPRWDETQVALYSRAMKATTIVVEGGANARYVASGHLAYVRQGVLMTVPFDLAAMKITGGSTGLIGDVMQAAYEPNSNSDSGAAQFDVSETGMLAYVTGGVVPEAARSLHWVDRTGRDTPLPIPQRSFQQPRVSPDGRRVAVATTGANLDIWIFDVGRGTFTRLTTEGRNGTPVWTPDSTRLAYRSGLRGPDNLFWRAADGSGAAERLTTSPRNQVPASWSPDGQALVFYDMGNDLTSSTNDFWTAPIPGHGPSKPLIENTFTKGGGDISPDGQWLAYHSNESGRFEIYVQPYGRAGARQLVSSGGGWSPVWRRDGKEIFYVEPSEQASVNSMMAVPVSTLPTFKIGAPMRLFSGPYALLNSPARAYDVTSDGQRFLVVQEKDVPSVKLTNIVLVQNWFAEIDRRAPASK